jgi:RNA polymerase sigma-70 factor (ECF subfamily)
MYSGVEHDLAERAERFHAIMLPHMDAAYSLARYLSRDPVAADDIVQEAFLNAFRGFDGWRGDAAKAWLLAIVRNCFLAGARGQENMAAIEEAEAIPLDEPTPEEIIITRRELASLHTEIEGLPQSFREVLILRELEELSYKEIATIIDTPIGTVMSRLARARKMLGDRLTSAKTPVSGEQA